VQSEERLGRLRRHALAGVAQGAAQPERLARHLGLVDLRLPPSDVREDEPGEPRADDEAHDEQPDIELAGHGGECTRGARRGRKAATTLLRCST
jgi:hypothetical protein